MFRWSFSVSAQKAMSSANLSASMVSPPILTPCFTYIFISFTTSLIYRLNSIGDRLQPCRIPFLIFASSFPSMCTNKV